MRACGRTAPSELLAKLLWRYLTKHTHFGGWALLCFIFMAYFRSRVALFHEAHTRGAGGLCGVFPSWLTCRLSAWSPLSRNTVPALAWWTPPPLSGSNTAIGSSLPFTWCSIQQYMYSICSFHYQYRLRTYTNDFCHQTHSELVETLEVNTFPGRE